MHVTICELACEPDALEREFAALAAHTSARSPDLVLLPELCFAPWLPGTRDVDVAAWDRAAANQAAWLARLPELGVRVVVGTRPVTDERGRTNEGFVWESDTGVRGVHRKTYLPDEPGFWEATWYDRGPTQFELARTAAGTVGFLICTELWFLERARAHGAAGADLIVCPRATPEGTTDKWVAGGQVAGVCAGAFCLSSNRGGAAGEAVFGGTGWASDPEANLLARTTRDEPFMTVELDLEVARGAKQTYPRYVDDAPVE